METVTESGLVTSGFRYFRRQWRTQNDERTIVDEILRCCVDRVHIKPVPMKGRFVRELNVRHLSDFRMIDLLRKNVHCCELIIDSEHYFQDDRYRPVVHTNSQNTYGTEIPVLILITALVEAIVSIVLACVECHFSCFCCKKSCFDFDTTTTQQVSIYAREQSYGTLR